MQVLSTVANKVPARPRTEAELPFTRRPMVDWLHPGQLAMTGVKAVISATFGSYADKREIQAALDVDDHEVFDHAQGDDVWIDFIADTGDGFDSTYAIAWLAAQSQLRVRNGLQVETLPRASVLIQGGDQVYPTAGRVEYADRFEGPYRAALPWVAEQAPFMYVIPGNHDWYDGLTSFLRLFCQKRWIGGWQTRQRRSYFALKLPHDWWLFATDIQLESDLDEPQKRYFDDVIKEHLTPGRSRVILCTAEPNWVYCGTRTPDDALVTAGARPQRSAGGGMVPTPKRFENLAYFESRVLANKGIRQVVTLSGDLHHYTRYQAVSERVNGATTPVTGSSRPQRITVGGGGAYMYGTHHMPGRIEMPELRHDGGEVTRRYALTETFPSSGDSRRLAAGILALPLRNKAFAGVLASMYLLLIWVMESASKGSYAFQQATGWTSLLEWGAARPSLALLAGNCVRVMQLSPSSVILTLGVLAGLSAYAYSERGRIAHAFWGMLHGAVHLGVALLLMGGVGTGGDVSAPTAFARFVTLSFVGGWIAGGLVFAIYLLSSCFLFCLHLNDVYSGQHIKDYKCFVRMHVGKTLTIYPIGLKDTPSWKVAADGAPTDPWLAPDGDAPTPILIEPPIVVS